MIDGMRYQNLGVVAAELPPSAGNPRNSEGTFLELADGELIFVYSRFKGDSPNDHAYADLALMRSVDGGLTWTDEGVILTCEGEGGVNMMSPGLLMMEDGKPGLFYLVRITYAVTKVFLRRSPDGGRTWGERTVCTEQEDFFVLNNDRIVRLTSGRIRVPVASHRSWGGDGRMDGNARAMFFYSDDDGRTWACSRSRCSLPWANTNSGLQEPGLVELAPGILWAWARTDLFVQYEMFSMDNGETWTASQPSRFSSPCSPLSMKRDGNGTLYAVWNPVPEYNGRAKSDRAFLGGRTPMVIASSTDNGKSFSVPVAFETDEASGYCYCAMYFTKDALLLGYCAGSEADGSCLVRTRVRRVERRELEGI
nr:sialidase family protein [uncultured Acetatifactor sp.]